MLRQSWSSSFLEGFERRGKRPRDLVPSAAPGRARSRSAPARRRSGAKRSIPLGTLRPRALARSSTCLRRAHGLGDDVVAARDRGSSQRADRSVLIAPMPLSAAGRERVAGHAVALLQRALGLIVQRRADVLDRVDEVQAGGEQLQVGVLRGRRGGRRHHELREIEQRLGMLRADRPCRRRNGTSRPAPSAALAESASSQAAR